jgi:hypothetical protein
MKQRTLGILGGALLVGGVVLGIASGIVSNRIAPADTAPMARPHVGPIQEHGGPGQPGPFFGNPRQRDGFPGSGQRFPNVTRPRPPASPSPSG